MPYDPSRLLRQKWADPDALARELYVMFSQENKANSAPSIPPLPTEPTRQVPPAAQVAAAAQQTLILTPQAAAVQFHAASEALTRAIGPARQAEASRVYGAATTFSASGGPLVPPPGPQSFELPRPSSVGLIVGPVGGASSSELSVASTVRSANPERPPPSGIGSDYEEFQRQDRATQAARRQPAQQVDFPAARPTTSLLTGPPKSAPVSPSAGVPADVQGIVLSRVYPRGQRRPGPVSASTYSPGTFALSTAHATRTADVTQPREEWDDRLTRQAQDPMDLLMGQVTSAGIPRAILLTTGSAAMIPGAGQCYTLDFDGVTLTYNDLTTDSLFNASLLPTPGGLIVPMYLAYQYYWIASPPTFAHAVVTQDIQPFTGGVPGVGKVQLYYQQNGAIAPSAGSSVSVLNWYSVTGQAGTNCGIMVSEGSLSLEVLDCVQQSGSG